MCAKNQYSLFFGLITHSGRSSLASSFNSSSEMSVRSASLFVVSMSSTGGTPMVQENVRTPLGTFILCNKHPESILDAGVATGTAKLGMIAAPGVPFPSI